jgi:hypothetical protein
MFRSIIVAAAPGGRPVRAAKRDQFLRERKPYLPDARVILARHMVRGGAEARL